MKEVLARKQILNADTQLFRPKTHSSFTDAMTEQPRGNISEPTAASVEDPLSDDPCVVHVDAEVEHGTRLAFLGFLEALFGDVVYHFCSFGKGFPADELLLQAPGERYLVFEVDSFLDAHIELGCREFFRHCFQTEVRGVHIVCVVFACCS